MLPHTLQLRQPLCPQRGQHWVLMAFSWCNWENRAALMLVIPFRGRSSSNFVAFGSCHAEKRAKPPINAGAPRPCSGAAPRSPGKRNDPIFQLDFPGTVRTRLPFGQAGEAHEGRGKVWSSRWGSPRTESSACPNRGVALARSELQNRKTTGKPCLQLLLGIY